MSIPTPFLVFPPATPTPSSPPFLRWPDDFIGRMKFVRCRLPCALRMPWRLIFSQVFRPFRVSLNPIFICFAAGFRSSKTPRVPVSRLLGRLNTIVSAPCSGVRVAFHRVVKSRQRGTQTGRVHPSWVHGNVQDIRHATICVSFHTPIFFSLTIVTPIHLIPRNFRLRRPPTRKFLLRFQSRPSFSQSYLSPFISRVLCNTRISPWFRVFQIVNH